MTTSEYKSKLQEILDASIAQGDLSPNGIIGAGAVASLLDYISVNRLEDMSPVKEPVTRDAGGLTDDIVGQLRNLAEDTILDSERYFQWYQQDKDADWLELSRSELRNFETVIKKSREYGIAEDQLKDLILRHHVVLAKF